MSDLAKLAAEQATELGKLKSELAARSNTMTCSNIAALLRQAVLLGGILSVRTVDVTPAPSMANRQRVEFTTSDRRTFVIDIIEQVKP